MNIHGMFLLVFRHLLLPVALLASVPVARAVPADARWDDRFGPRGIDGKVVDAVDYRGGLAVCGNLIVAGASEKTSAAWWDGSAWHAMGATLSGGELSHLAVTRNALVASQSKSSGRYSQMLSWDGTVWHPFGGDLIGDTFALAVWNDQLVAGGAFTMAGGVAAAYVARWDGSSWHPLGSGPGGGVRQLVAAGGDLFALVLKGGYTPDVARWDGYTWQSIGAGLRYGLSALCYHNGQVVAGGSDSSDYPTAWTMSWDGTTWSAGPPVPAMGVTALITWRGRLLASLYNFSLNPHVDEDRWWVAQQFDSGWSTIGSSTTDSFEVGTYGPDLLAFGHFVSFEGRRTSGVAAWNGTVWRALDGPGAGITGGPVTCIANVDGAPTIGGAPFSAAGSAVANVASWTGSDWIGHGMEGRQVGAIISHAGHVELAGSGFWIRSPCSAVVWWGADYVNFAASESFSGACALASHAGSLYIGFVACLSSHIVGGLGVADPPPLNGSRANALLSWDGRLVAAGVFTDAGGIPIGNIAAYDGVAWQEVGWGLDGPVCALAAWGNRLVAAGSFAHAGGDTVRGIAVWDGSSWSRLGTGFNDRVNALAVVAGRLYAGGDFTAAGTTPIAHVGCWDGAAWRALGSGVDGSVLALQAIGSDLWVGGDFTRAGDKWSLHVARWNDALVPVHLSGFTATRENGRVQVCWQVADAGPTTRFQLWRERPGGTRAAVGVCLPADRLMFSVFDPDPPVEAASYWLQELAADGSDDWYGPANLAAASIPTALRLSQNHPNPFNPRTSLSFSLPQPTHVTLGLYDQRGRLVRTLVDGALPAGEQAAEWDGCDGQGRPVASGSYVARLVTDDGILGRKITLAR